MDLGTVKDRGFEFVDDKVLKKKLKSVAGKNARGISVYIKLKSGKQRSLIFLF